MYNSAELSGSDLNTHQHPSHNTETSTKTIYGNTSLETTQENTESKYYLLFSVNKHNCLAQMTTATPTRLKLLLYVGQ